MAVSCFTLSTVAARATPIVQGNTVSQHSVTPFIWTAFTVEARAGNQASTYADQLRLLDSSGVSTFTAASPNLAWTNGTPFTFQLGYDAAARALSLTVDGVTLVAGIAASSLVRDVIIQATSTGSMMTVSDLSVRGVNLASSLSQASQVNLSNQIQYLWISGLRDSFQLSGRIPMSWYASAPSNSSAATNFRLATSSRSPYDSFASAEVPEPSTFVLLGLSLLALGGWRVKART